MIDEKVVERKLLLQRAFSRGKLFKIGKELNIQYFNSFQGAWDIDEERGFLELAFNVSDEQLKNIFEGFKPRKWTVFRGQHYTFEDGELQLEGSWKTIQAAVAQIKKKYGENCVTVLKLLLESAEGRSLRYFEQNLPEGTDPSPILSDLEKHKIIVVSYKSDKFREWTILDESRPIITLEAGLTPGEDKEKGVSGVSRKEDAITEEQRIVKTMDRELDYYLNDLLKHRADETVAFGKSFSISQLGTYLKDLFGPVVFFDSLLSITQQYGLADVEIVHATGRTGMQTGWNLSLFGEPGTGKSFSTRDIILGKLGAKVPPHGVPGRNRYAGGITPTRFIRIGQAYSGKVFNFIIPEFNDWFKYRGMVEPLKLAMEHGEIKYETHREVIGPYRFSSFFSVNYNVAASGRNYEVTVQDPNFNAIEDRMLCRLHRLTKKRFTEIAQSQMRLAFGEIDVEEGAQQIRDHLSLVFAAEVEHPLVKNRFLQKPVMLTQKAKQLLRKAREAILEEIPREVVSFSARLEDRAIRFASAAALINYFQSNLDYVPVSEEALNYAIRLYVEEASVRSQKEFEPESVLKKLPAW